MLKPTVYSRNWKIDKKMIHCNQTITKNKKILATKKNYFFRKMKGFLIQFLIQVYWLSFLI